MRHLTMAAALLFLAACGSTTENNSNNGKTDGSATPAPTTDQTADLRTQPAEVQNFVKDGFNVLDSVRGHFDSDIHTDMIYILHKPASEIAFEDDAPRPLFVFVGQADKTWKLAARSENAVLCAGCGGVFGDPYAGLSAGKQRFTVHHYGGSNWRWQYDAIFAYSEADKTWLLDTLAHGTEQVMDASEEPTHDIFTAKKFGKVTLTDCKDPGNYVHK